MAFSIITKHVKKKSRQVGKDEYAYPFNMDDLILALQSNPYHKQCLNIKTMNILGNGFDDKTMKILEEITPNDSAIGIMTKTIVDLESFGNAFWEIYQNNTIIQIFHAPAQTMCKTKTGFKQKVGDKEVAFTDKQIFHFKYNTPFSTVYGAPDYLPILKTIKLYDKIIAYNDNFFANNAIPDMAIVVEGAQLSSRAKYTVQRFFRDKFQGYENAHKVLYLPVNEGVKVRFEKLQSDMKDASFMKLLTQTITDIIACHGVPPRLISIVNQSQLGGGGETSGQMDIFFKTVIKPKQRIISGIMNEFNKQFKIFPENTNFNLIELEYEKENNSLDSLLRKV